MNTWYEYRLVWSNHPWLAVYLVLVVLVLVVAIIATATGGGPLSILFVPALGGLYVHHLLAMKRLHADD